VSFLRFPYWRYCHVDTVEVIKAESQVLNSSTEDDFQDMFKKL
jgi:hypothetical protein